MFAAETFTFSSVAINILCLFAGAGAHATWLRVKAWHGRR